MTTVARLSADLTADSARFEAGMRRATGSMTSAQKQWQNTLNKAGRDFDGLGRKVDNTSAMMNKLQTTTATLFGGAAIAVGAKQIVQYADTYTQLEGRLRIVSGSMDEVRDRQQALFEIAQRTRQPLESVVSLYTRLNQAVPEGQRAQYDLLGVTESINMALAITGEGSAQATSAVLQFSQAIQSDFKGSAQEINSLVDSAPRLAQALQKSFGDGSKSLKQLSAEGKLSSREVLQALSAMGAQGQALRSEFSQIGVTVGQALTQLDNALLNYIGLSEDLRGGTSSIALAIQSLAESFDTVATVATFAGAVIAGRFIASMTASAGAMAVDTAAKIANSRQTLALAAANQAGAFAMYEGFRRTGALTGAMIINEGAAKRLMIANQQLAAAQKGVIGVTGTLKQSLLSAFGGPVGIAILAVAGAMYALNRDTQATQETQTKWDEVARSFEENMGKMQGASENTRKQIVEDNDAMIQSAIRQMEVYSAQLEGVLGQKDNGLFGAFAVGAQELWTSLGADGVRPSQAIKQFDAVAASLKKMREIAEKPAEGGAGAGISSATSADLKAAETRRKSVEGMLQSLQDESTKLHTQVNLYGEKESAINRALKAQEIYTRIEREGLTLTEEQRKEVQAYLDDIEKQTEKYKELEDQTKANEKADEERREGLRQLAYTFTSGFEDAIVEGEKLSDVLNELAKDVAKVALRMGVTAPLTTAIGNMFGDFGSNLFGISSHAAGVDVVPRDMTARIHKGERILTAREAKEADAATGGGVNVIINNNSPARVSATPSEGGNGMDLTVMVEEVVASGINKQGSRINRSLSNFNKQGLTRR